jgi:hypothetical protein
MFFGAGNRYDVTIGLKYQKQRLQWQSPSNRCVSGQAQNKNSSTTDLKRQIHDHRFHIIQKLTPVVSGSGCARAEMFL